MQLLNKIAITINHNIPLIKGSKITVALQLMHRITKEFKVEELIILCIHPEYAIVEAIKLATSVNDMKIRPTDLVDEWVVLAAWIK